MKSAFCQTRWFTPMLVWWLMLALDIWRGDRTEPYQTLSTGWYLGAAIPTHLWSLWMAKCRKRCRERTTPEELKPPPGPPATQG